MSCLPRVPSPPAETEGRAVAVDEEEEGACLSRNSFDVNVVSLVILGGTGVAVEELLGTLAEFAFNEDNS